MKSLVAMNFTVTVLCAIISVVAATVVEKWHNSADGSKFYIDSENKFNWYDAWNECARKNMSLIAVDTQEKHLQIDTLIRKLFPTCPSFWIAGHDNAIDLRYEWPATGEIFSFTNWGAGQPDRANNNEHCILIWQGTWQWYDLPCAHKLGFICEENRYIKEKFKELEAVKKQCPDISDTISKFKNVVMYINSSPKFQYSYGNEKSATQAELA